MIALLLAALYTSTMRVNAVAREGDTLWTATGGGVEQYDLAAGQRLRLFTTEDGLDANEVLDVRSDAKVLRARTARSLCTLTQAGVFACAPAERILPAAPAVAPLWQGARVTVRAGDVVATDGAGTWVDGRRLTPEGQLCGNRVQALEAFRGALWVGTFDTGLCALEDGRFRSVPTPFRMVNDLRASGGALFVATGEGLFVTEDGRTFRREPRVHDRGVNRLALSRKWLFATSPATLYAIRIDGRRGFRRFRHPAGSTSLQGVAVSGADVWLASEDCGAIRFRAGRFEPFDRASGLPSSWAVDVAPASQGGVWVATLRDGAVRLAPDGRIRERRGPGTWGLRLYRDGESILFGTQQGIEGWAVPLPDPRVHALLRFDGALWVATEVGLARLDALAAAR